MVLLAILVTLNMRADSLYLYHISYAEKRTYELNNGPFLPLGSTLSL